MPIWKYPVHLVAYGFGTGLVPVAPGSFGTLVGVGLYRAMGSLRPLYYWGLTALMWIVGVPICAQTAVPRPDRLKPQLGRAAWVGVGRTPVTPITSQRRGRRS